MTNIDPALVETLTDVRMREHFGKRWDDISTDPAYDEALKSYRNFYRQHADDALAALAPLIAAAVEAARAEGYEQGKAAVREWEADAPRTEALRELLYDTLETLRIDTTTDDIDVLADAVLKSAWLVTERVRAEADAFAFTNQVRADAKATRAALKATP